MQELLLKRKHLFFLHFFTNYCESFRTHMIIFACPKRKFRPKKRDPLRKFHRTYGLPLENYLSDRANHYRKCLTVRRPLGNTVRSEELDADTVYSFVPNIGDSDPSSRCTYSKITNGANVDLNHSF